MATYNKLFEFEMKFKDKDWNEPSVRAAITDELNIAFSCGISEGVRLVCL